MTEYDKWLYNQIPEECLPKVIEIHYEPSDDTYATEPEYNCQYCDNKECEYWKEYNVE